VISLKVFLHILCSEPLKIEVTLTACSKKECVYSIHPSTSLVHYPKPMKMMFRCMVVGRGKEWRWGRNNI